MLRRGPERLRGLLFRLLILAGMVAPLPAGACAVRDFLALDLSAADRADPVRAALELAYPGLAVDRARGTVALPGGAVLPLGTIRGLPPARMLEEATIAEQFAQVYPLAFDLRARERPWFDPGRFRNEAFFRALWFDSARAAFASLATVTYRGAGRSVAFQITTRHCAAAQAQAALDAAAALGPEMGVYFDEVGGSFNWRRIAGTDRLSTHSFGIAFDLNTRLGGYWRWAGAREGAAGPYANRFPEALVGVMERHGFIWGGKWHHYDGMHFEYRPELILHARLVGG